MFDSKKIQLNHIRSSNHQDFRANKLFFILSEMLLNRAFDRIKLTDKKNILEIGARNNSLSNLLESKKLRSNFFQTTQSREIKIKSNKKVVANFKHPPFKISIFDICFSILSINSSENMPLTFKSIYDLLKPNGSFLTVLPSDECIKEFRSFFLNFFKPKRNFSFNPALDIKTLGNIGSSAGFKNIIVDKEEFNFEIKNPEEIWRFIRFTGESNYLQHRKDFKIKKTLYKDFYLKYKNAIINETLRDNTLSFYFFIGTK